MPQYSSYIASRLHKYKIKNQCKISEQNLEWIDKVLSIDIDIGKGDTRQIKDIISRVDPNYQKQQQEVKAKGQNMINELRTKRLADSIQFDFIFEENKQYVQTVLRSVNNNNCQIRISLAKNQAVYYLKTMLNLNEIKTKTLQRCLVELIKIIKSYEIYSCDHDKKKTQKKQYSSSSINMSNLSVISEDKFQNDNQQWQELGENKEKIQEEGVKLKQKNMYKKSKEKVEQVQIQKQREMAEIKSMHGAQKQQLNEQLIKFEKTIQDLQESLDKTNKIVVESQQKLQIQQNKNANISTTIQQLKSHISNLQKQKQELRIKLINFRNQLSNSKQDNQIAINSIKIKQETVQTLLAYIDGNKSEQQRITNELRSMEARENRIAVLENLIKQKEEQIQQVKKQKQEQIGKLEQQIQQTKRSRRTQLALDNNYLGSKKELEDVMIEIQKEKHVNLKLREDLQSREREIHHLKQQIAQLQSRRDEISYIGTNNNAQIEQRFNEQMRTSMQDAKTLKQRFEAIIRRYEQEKAESENMIEQLTNICQQLTAENQKLSQQLSNEKELKKEQNRILDQQVKQATQAVRQLNKNRGKLQQQSRQLQSKILNLSNTILTLKSQNKHMAEQNNQQKLKLQDLHARVIILQQNNNKWSTAVAEHQNLLRNYQSQIVELTEQKESQKNRYIAEIQKLNNTIRELESSKFQTNYECLNQQITALTVSPILEANRQKRQLLIRYIQKFTNAIVFKTQLKYKFDKYSLNFSHYLNNQSYPILVLFKVARNGHIIGVFCTSIANSKTQDSGQTFVFSLQKNGKVFNKIEGGYPYACRYADSMLIFGNNELYVKNNSSQKIFKLNTSMVGSKYFNIDRDQSLLGYANNGNEVGFEEMEIHKIYYS